LPRSESPAESREATLKRLIDVGTALVSELDVEAVLRSVVEAAQEVTSARYAALGVIDRDRQGLERFIQVGIDEETRRAIGDLPRGRGVLGELIRRPEVLRLRDVSSHPRAYGFPPGHPPMRSFLGVPISVRGEVFGNLYMSEKRGADEFEEDDETAARTLAIWAGIAIENARLYSSLREHETEVEQALRQSQISVDVARAVGGETDVHRVLDLIVKRARALVEARTVIVLLNRFGTLAVAALAGVGDEEARDMALPEDDSVLRAAMEQRVAKRLEAKSPPSEARLRERFGAEAALVVPLLFRGRGVGVLIALDREASGPEFDDEDLHLLEALAASAATAVATAQTVEAERIQQQAEIGELERRRWARELHDDSLQRLTATRIFLATALQGEVPDRAARIERAARDAVEELSAEIEELSRLVDDLRPGDLERLGLTGGLESLAHECASRAGIEVATEIAIDSKLAAEEEQAVYRVAQEALNNVRKHSSAAAAELSVTLADGEVVLAVRDDGRGFTPGAAGENRGLSGMQERVELLGGELEISSAPEGGTRVAARIPVQGD
jgi:two-component system, NarL family, sensor histidine kinase DevS